MEGFYERGKGDGLRCAHCRIHEGNWITMRVLDSGLECQNWGRMGSGKCWNPWRNGGLGFLMERRLAFETGEGENYFFIEGHFWI